MVCFVYYNTIVAQHVQAVRYSAAPWAARYTTGLLINLTLKGVVFLFFSYAAWCRCDAQ